MEMNNVMMEMICSMTGAFNANFNVAKAVWNVLKGFVQAVKLDF